MKMEMTGKVVLVAGATSGIGKAAAEMFAKNGASVVLAGRRENLLREITDSLKASGCTAAYVVCDVTDEKQVEHMIRFTAETFGRLDYAYNNAGIMSDDVETAELESSEFDRVINVNLRSMFLCLKYELRIDIRIAEAGRRGICHCQLLLHRGTDRTSRTGGLSRLETCGSRHDKMCRTGVCVARDPDQCRLSCDD